METDRYGLSMCLLELLHNLLDGLQTQVSKENELEAVLSFLTILEFLHSHFTITTSPFLQVKEKEPDIHPVEANTTQVL